MSHEAAIVAAGGRFLGEAHGTVWFTDPETQSTLALPATEITTDNIAMTLLRSRRSFRQEQLRLLIEGLQDYAISMVNQAGLIVSWNTGAERIYGYNPQEIIGRPLTVLYFGAEQETMRQALSQARREGRYEGEMWNRRKDSAAIWGDVIISSLRDEAEQVRGYSFVCRDLTRRHLQQQLQRARVCVSRILTDGSRKERVLPLFLECVCEHLEWDFAECWMRKNHSDRVRLGAAHCRNQAGANWRSRIGLHQDIPLDHVVPKQAASSLYPKVVQKDNPDLAFGQVCFPGKMVETALVLPMRDQNTSYGWLLLGHLHRRDPNSEEIEVVDDLAQLLHRYLQQQWAKRQLQRLTRQMQKQAGLLDRVLNASPDLVYLVNREGRYTYVNAKGAAILGVEPGGLVGKLPEEAGLPVDRIAPLQQELRRVIETGEPWRAETSFLAVHGFRDFEYILAPVWSRGGRVESVVISARDITERKHTEERLRVVLEQLPAIVWTTDESLRFTSSTGAGLSPLGLKPHEVMGMRMEEFARDQPFEAATMEAHRKALDGQRVAYRTIWKQRLLNVWVQPLRRLDGSIQGTIGLAFDITDQTHVEAPAAGDELQRDLVQRPPGSIEGNFTLLRKYLEIAGALLSDLAGRYQQPEDQGRRQAVLALAEQLRSIAHQLDRIADTPTSMTSDAS